MGDAIGGTLAFAIGIAISPIPIAAVILMLFSGRARVNSVAFMVAWVIGIALAASVVTIVPGLQADDSEPGDTTGWIKLVLAALLLLVGVRQWRGRPGPDDAVPVPGWMEKIDGLGPGAAFGLGIVLSALNPKNLLLAVAGGASMAALELSTAEMAGSIAVFTAIAAITVVVPVGAYLLAGRRLDTTLEAAKTWLIDNNAAVMAVLLVVFGASLLGDAIQILT